MKFHVLASTLITLSAASNAAAHISLESGGTHQSRYGDDEQKDAPCGLANGARGTNVYTYEPGQTITVSVREVIPHPSYFRIAFDDDGDDDFEEPASIKPIDPNRPCPYNADDKCGESDFFNNSTVLMDNLDPHLASGAKTYTWQVELPDVECDNCTLQVIQVMEDVIHGPYNPNAQDTEFLYIEDIYHQCIDLVLRRSAGPTTDGGAFPPPGTGGAPPMGAGGQTMNGFGGTPSSGGTSFTGGGGSAGTPVGVSGAPSVGVGAGGASQNPVTPGGSSSGSPSLAAGTAGALWMPAPGDEGDDGSCAVQNQGNASGHRPGAWLALVLLALAVQRRRST